MKERGEHKKEWKEDKKKNTADNGDFAVVVICSWVGRQEEWR